MNKRKVLWKWKMKLRFLNEKKVLRLSKNKVKLWETHLQNFKILKVEGRALRIQKDKCQEFQEMQSTWD